MAAEESRCWLVGHIGLKEGASRFSESRDRQDWVEWGSLLLSSNPQGQEEELGTDLERELKWGARMFMKAAKQAPKVLLLGSFPNSQAQFVVCCFGVRSGSVSSDPTKGCPVCIGSRRTQRLQLTL